MQKEKTQKAPRENTLFIAILKFVPLIVLVLLILIAELDLLLAGPIAVFVAIAVAMYTNRVDFNTVYHIGLDSASKIIEVFFISQFAYAVAECFMATGVGASVINLALSAGVTPQTIGPLALIVTCVVSLATGTSWGTFAACAPIFLWMNYLIGGNLLLVTGACAGGSCFGDNIGMISDTTVLSCGMQDVKIIDRVKHQLVWSAGVAVITAVVIFVVSLSYPSAQGDIQAAFSAIPEETYEALAIERPGALALLEQVRNGVAYYMVIPLILVIGLAFMGVSTLLCLGAGMLSSLILGSIAGTCTISGWLNDMVYAGFSSSGSWTIVMMLWISAFGGIMNSMNAFEPVAKLVVKISRSVQSLMGWCGVLCMLGNAALADEAAEIATFSPMIRSIVEENVETADEKSAYTLRLRLATYTDALGVFGSMLMPWHCYTVYYLAIAAAVFPLHDWTPMDIIGGNLMGIIAVVSIVFLSFTGLDRFVPGFALPGKDKAWLKNSKN